MEILIIILDIIIYILIVISFIFYFESRRISKKIIAENETLNRNLKSANLTIQSLQEQLELKRKEYDELTSENKHLYEQLKSYQNILEVQEQIEKEAEKLQENVEVKEPKKTTTKKASNKKTSTKKDKKPTNSTQLQNLIFSFYSFLLDSEFLLLLNFLILYQKSAGPFLLSPFLFQSPEPVPLAFEHLLSHNLCADYYTSTDIRSALR